MAEAGAGYDPGAVAEEASKWDEKEME